MKERSNGHVDFRSAN
jgi:CubicO group peptidase (beta-lactamase class C family)